MTRFATSVATLIAFTGCPDHSQSVLWLAPDQNETHVKLVNSEPGTF